MKQKEDHLPTGHAGIDQRLTKAPRIHESAFVLPGATVVGDVTLEEESSVWYGAVLRGDINRIVVGRRSNIQDNAVVHLDDKYPALIGELVTVGHSAIVHACTVDDEVLIGMGAIVLDGAEIGGRSIIGANALVTLGMKVRPARWCSDHRRKLRANSAWMSRRISRHGRPNTLRRRNASA